MRECVAGFLAEFRATVGDGAAGEPALGREEVHGLRRDLAEKSSLLDRTTRALAFFQLATPEESLEVYARRVLRERDAYASRAAAAAPGEELATAVVVAGAGVPVLAVRGAVDDASLARFHDACERTGARVVLLELEREPFATAVGPAQVPR